MGVVSSPREILCRITNATNGIDLEPTKYDVHPCGEVRVIQVKECTVSLLNRSEPTKEKEKVATVESVEITEFCMGSSQWSEDGLPTLNPLKLAGN
jgi:hypothetical protein